MSWISRYSTDPDPGEFTCVEESGARIVIRRGYDDPITRAALFGGEGRVIGRTTGGRGSHPVIELASGERILLREYRRGGVIRHFNRTTYFTGNRALEELRITVVARNRGLGVARMIAAIERPARFGYSAMLAIGWIDGAAELATLLEFTPPHDRPGVVHLAGVEIGKMHDAGIAHPDLNLRNLLIAPGEDTPVPRVVIIDFDRAWVRSTPVPAWRRRAELRRFVRSTWRLGAPMGAPEFEAFRDGYGSAWPLPARLG